MRFFPLLAVLVLTFVSGQVLAQEEGEALPPAAAPAEAATAITNTTPPAFYQSGIRMGTSYCAGFKFDCNTLTVEQSAIIDAANSCISSRFGIDHKIMASYVDSGEFENCVLPSSPSVNARNLREWAVCCIKRNTDGQCTLECTRYIDQKPGN